MKSSMSSARLLPVSRSRPRISQVRCETQSRSIALRHALRRPEILLGPSCYDGLSARLIERFGFPYTFMSGFATSAAKIGAPDVGLLTYSEMVRTGREICEATNSIPVIGDGDTGYGNPLNVKRTVSGYAKAGFAGILIEDQVWPKSCGHVRQKQVVSREEAIARVIAAVEARDESEDILILARTDARQAESFEEALYRVQAFADAGADILFIDALASVEEMKGFCSLVPLVPKLANMLEGGGKTPILSPQELQDIGYKLVAYPLSLLGVSIKAMNGALEDLKEGKVPDLSFQEIQEILGFDDYFSQKDGYQQKAKKLLEKRVSRPLSTTAEVSDDTNETDRPLNRDVDNAEGALEADEVLPPQSKKTSNKVVVLDREAESEQEGSKKMASFARIVVTNMKTGEIKLETRIPIGFIRDISKLVPEMADFDLRGILDKTDTVSSSPVFTFTEKKNKTEIFLE